MREVKQLARKKSMQAAHTVEKKWRESEEKAKAFERTRKASFNKARQLSKKVCVRYPFPSLQFVFLFPSLSLLSPFLCVCVWVCSCQRLMSGRSWRESRRRGRENWSRRSCGTGTSRHGGQCGPPE